MDIAGRNPGLMDARAARTGGWIAILCAVAGLVIVAIDAVVPAQVPATQYSAPLSPAGFTGQQIALGLHHWALAIGVWLLGRAGLAGRGRLAVVGTALSAIAFVAIGVQELVAIAVAHADDDSAAAGIVDTGYGIVTILLAVTLAVLGIATLRARVFGAARWWGLITAVAVIVLLIPAQFVTGIAGTVMIGAWFLLFLWPGIAAVRLASRAPVPAREPAAVA